MKLTVEIVKAARELISDRAHWGKGHFAGSEKYSLDRICENEVFTDPKATCFCALGAVSRAAFEKGANYDDAVQARLLFTVAVNSCVPEQWRGAFMADVTDFNDAAETTHEDVLGAFDCLIAKMESVS